MRWRPLSALAALTPLQETVPVYPSNDKGRSVELAEALARLEAATRLRDREAVARILDGLSGTEDGQWLLRQCVSAGLREVAAVIAEADAPTDGRSFGAA